MPPRQNPLRRDDLDGLTPLQDEFIEWQLTPPTERQPQSQNQWALEHDVSPSLVTGWKRTDPFYISALKRRVAERGLNPEMMHRIIQAQADKAAKGDTHAAKVVFDYVKWLDPDPPKADVLAAPSDMSDEELAAELQSLIDDLGNDA